MTIHPLSEIESKNYLSYLYEHINDVCGYDSKSAISLRDILYGREKDVSVVMVKIIRASGAMRPYEWRRENKINKIIDDV